MKVLLHSDFIVRDMSASLEFYVGKLGCSVVEDAILQDESVEFLSGGAAEQMRLVLLKLQVDRPGTGGMIELMQFLPKPNSPSENLGPVASRIPTHCLAIMVHKIDMVLAELRDKGVNEQSPVFAIELPKTGRSRIAFIKDPDQNLIELIEV